MHTPCTIAGVSLRQLRLVSTPRGKVREFVRCDDPDFPGFGQVHVVETLPGVVRAWYRHQHQVDQLNAIAGRCRVCLFDDRPGSPSHGNFMEVVLSHDQPAVLSFPAQIWHGFATVGDTPSVIVQHNSRAFNHQNPDEEKRPADDTYFPVVW